MTSAEDVKVFLEDRSVPCLESTSAKYHDFTGVPVPKSRYPSTTLVGGFAK